MFKIYIFLSIYFHLIILLKFLNRRSHLNQMSLNLFITKYEVSLKSINLFFSKIFF